jgi:hypothetical protein
MRWRWVPRRDDRLARALAPTIDASVRESVARDPRALADALFPILGPAIRKSVLATILGMVQSLNHAVEQSLTIRGLRWRLQAWRTGLPYGEVVLLNTLVYRVEQVVLIHRDSGLVLHHVAAGGLEAQDPDLVSAMLTALQSFMEDAFTLAGSRLDTIRMDGEHSLWVQQGPRTVLAALIRGTPPVALRERLDETLEAIEDSHGAALAAFRGDGAAFADLAEPLEGLLEARFSGGKGAGIAPFTWILLAVLLLLPVFLGVRAWLGERARDELVAALDQEPGIVVTGAADRGGVFRIRGLRDPLARDPAGLVRASALAPERVVLDLEPYRALEPAFVRERVVRALAPPEGVAVELDGAVLRVRGRAPAAWAERLAIVAPVLDGVDTVDREDLVVPELDALRRLLGAVEGTVLYAEVGSARMLPGQEDTLGALVRAARELIALAAELGWAAQIRITGYADASGPEGINEVLSGDRARAVRRLLADAGVPAHALSVEVGGALATGARAVGGPERLRRVEFVVAGLPAGVRGGP